MNYSKWDHIDVSDDSEEEGRGLPRVTKFEKPGSINISKEGMSFTPSSTTTTKPSSSSSFSSTSYTLNNKNTDNDSILWKNGAKLEKFHWSQSQTEVTLRFSVPTELAAKTIKIRFPDAKSLSITEINSKAANPFSFSGRFRYEVRTGDGVDSETGEFSDWEILTLQGQRYLVMALQKVSVLAGAVFWWDRAFEGDSPIDVTAIADRRGLRLQTQGGGRGGATATKSDSVDSSAATNVWEEAHRLFREKIASQQPHEVLIEDDNGVASST